MGQIIGGAAKPKRCNLQSLSSFGTPAAGEHILVSSDNSMNAAGQGNFDYYIVGDGSTAATALELKSIDGVAELAEEVGMIETTEDGFYVVDEQLNIGFAVDSTGAHAINLMEYEIVNI